MISPHDVASRFERDAGATCGDLAAHDPKGGQVAISKRLRYEVLRRDGYQCRYCRAADVQLTVDHVLPKSLGGSDDPANLVAACGPCNSGKSSSIPDAPLVANVDAEALSWSQAIRRAQAKMLEDIKAREADREQFREHWNYWTYGGKEDPQHFPMDPSWEQSVDQLLAAGLPLAVLIECIDIAMSQRKLRPEGVFRYMCGIGWNKVRGLHDIAKQLCGTDEGETPGLAAGGTYEQGKVAAAYEVLEELSPGERDQYIDWADDGGYGDAHGEPQTDGDKLASAAAIAVNDIRCDLGHLQALVVQHLDEVPDGAGQRAMKAARESLYDRAGADFTRMNFLTVALRNLYDELHYPAAEKYLEALPDAERTEWIAYALTLYSGSDLTDAATLVRAAKCAQIVAQGFAYNAMCVGTGTHIAACPRRATHYARLGEMDCCGSDVAEDHPGHQVCGQHLEQLVDGTFVGRTGQARSAIDFSEIETNAGVPF